MTKTEKKQKRKRKRKVNEGLFPLFPFILAQGFEGLVLPRSSTGHQHRQKERKPQGLFRVRPSIALRVLLHSSLPFASFAAQHDRYVLFSLILSFILLPQNSPRPVLFSRSQSQGPRHCTSHRTHYRCK